ncbi:hypothetical protein GRI40_03425 [Altererythrobacter aerius]|uniref:Uncharacterized protein n=1 Tax=Tsuneonella aeria TaxID=1837929 RepID=A0A6I4TAY3_9SPHN|nr:hypothetical protein [Tsuneonella aeria]MXO74273.1 hypothetical protein [Tsuneonella aeria]
MNTFAAENWLLLAIAGAVLLILLWWIIAASRRTRVTIDRRDTLDEGAAPAARNQALIDAPPAATGTFVNAPLPPDVPEAIGGAGAAVAAAAAMADVRAGEIAEEDAAESDRPGVGDSDDLTRIKGLGPKLAGTLNALGITRFDQIAGWSDADIDRIDAQLGRFQGRIRRDDWTGQARLLASGDEAAFATRFGAS